ncbi:MAG: 2-dehydropantoate 2-reductase [Mariprofundaceae bacterium]|nr:2-dehydropantoate 2-reductase [Mariprofundaceae bacterium]
MLKVGVAGAGAVGCHYGSLLQQAGLDVVCLARGDHLAALKKNGLTHISGGKVTRLNVQASNDMSMLADCDVILLSCKTTVLDELCQQLLPVIGRNTVLVTMQNGVTAPGQVLRCFPDSPLVAASAFIGVRVERPGEVVHSAAGHIRLGVWQNESERMLSMLAELVAAWRRSGVDAEQAAEMKNMLWHKMLWNCGFNAITALTRCYARDVAADEDSARWVRAAMQEAIDVATAESIRLPEDAIGQHMALTMKAGPVKTSMWQDMEHGRPTEIEAMNGFVAQRARQLGLEAPVNDLLASLIRAASAR